MHPKLLDVVAVYSNPMRWKSRLKLHLEFEQHMLDSGVRLTVVECAYGERPFELPENKNINRVNVRAKTILWNKENLINIGVSRLPSDWKYLCWCDADIEFRKPSWASDAVHALQVHDVIQPWSDAYDLGPKDEHIQSHRSFCRQFVEGHPVTAKHANWWKFSNGPYDYPHSGYAWCCTRNAFEWVGGLIDWAILGAGDHHMALGLIGEILKSIPHSKIEQAYLKPLLLWESRALHHINTNIGFTWGTIEHKFHGMKTARKYVERWEIILKHKFNPETDIKRNSCGVYELCGNKQQLKSDLIQYFNQRNEDLNVLV